jgi:hypothetical protein
MDLPGSRRLMRGAVEAFPESETGVAGAVADEPPNDLVVGEPPDFLTRTETLARVKRELRRDTEDPEQLMILGFTTAHGRDLHYHHHHHYLWPWVWDTSEALNLLDAPPRSQEFWLKAEFHPDDPDLVLANHADGSAGYRRPMYHLSAVKDFIAQRRHFLRMDIKRIDYSEEDARLFAVMRELIDTEVVKSVFAAANEVAPLAAGSPSGHSKAKRLSTRYKKWRQSQLDTAEEPAPDPSA